MKKRHVKPYTGSVLDYHAEIDHDYGVPLTQMHYYILQRNIKYLCIEPSNERENPVLFRKKAENRTKSSVLVMFTDKEKASVAKNTCPKSGFFIKRISRQDLKDYARNHSHAIVNPDMSQDEVPANMELLSRID